MPALGSAELLSWQPGAWVEEGGARVAKTVLAPEAEWDELVVSWNCAAPNRQTLTVTASAEVGGRWTKPYVMGVWGSPDNPVRTSVNDQGDEDGEVLTDTLRLRTSGRRVRIALTVRGGPLDVDWVAASFSTRGTPAEPDEPDQRAWGRTIEVPQYRQMDYPSGDVVCSPTSLSMVLAHWSSELGKPGIASPVVQTCRWVYDPGWDGTGNWAFNMAFAGSRPGMRAYASRLASVAELEAWVAHGWPVVCSVSNSLLKGKGYADGNDGHLVVLVGFTESGEPVFNDPGREVTRQVYRRDDFQKAWDRSGRTVYLVYPSHLRPPEARRRNWHSPRRLPPEPG